jgi:hypothetical protein
LDTDWPPGIVARACRPGSYGEEPPEARASGALAGVFQARAVAARLVDVMYGLIDGHFTAEKALAVFEELAELGAQAPADGAWQADAA